MARWVKATLAIRCECVIQEAARLRTLQLDVGLKRRESASLGQALACEKAAHKAALDRLRTERRLSATARAERDEARRAAAAATAEAAAHASAAKAATVRLAKMAAAKNGEGAAIATTDAAKRGRSLPAKPHAASSPLQRESWSAPGSPLAESPSRAQSASTSASRDLVLAEVCDLERELDKIQHVLGSPPSEP
jgi:hypothetical protein